MKNLLSIFIFCISFIGQSQEKKLDSIYNYEDVTLKPSFSGGIEKFYKFIGKHYQIPEKLNTKVKVLTEFVIEKDGSISNITIVEDPGYGTGEEAIKALKKSPKWNPGEKDGVSVRTKYKPHNITQCRLTILKNYYNGFGHLA